MLLLSLVLILGCKQEINVRVDERVDTGEFVDQDGDGFGLAEDCDDTDAAVNPDADELCATVGVDDNCDGTADEDTAIDAVTWYTDSDSDGFGDAEAPQSACTQPDGFVSDSTDCDDSDAAVNPDADELCSTPGIDDDCDGTADEDDAIDGTTFFADTDGDGDGLHDLLIGAHGSKAGGISYSIGRVYLVLGASLGSPSILDLSLADHGFDGENQYDFAGQSVSSAGDVNGDGRDDLLVGAPSSISSGGTNPGRAYLILSGL